MESTLSITGVRTLSGQRGPIYKIQTDSGEYTTFDGPLGAVLEGLIGQTIRAETKVEQKGQYTNRYINRVLGSSDALPPLSFVGTGSTGNSSTYTTTFTGNNGADKGRIAGRNSLARAAVPYVLEMTSAQTKDDVIAILNWLTHWAETGEDYTAVVQNPAASFQQSFDTDIPF